MLLEAILGTRTKIRMLTCLMQHPEGITRKSLADLSDVSHRMVYDQVKDLEFLEIVIRKGNRYYLNEKHFLYHALLDILQMGLLHERQLEERILEFIHQKLKPHYYIGGFLAATRYITLVDYHATIIHVGVPNDWYDDAVQKFQVLKHHQRFSINEMNPDKTVLYFFKTPRIPSDVQLDHEIYYASLTRGTLECFILPGIIPYGQALVFLENLKEGLLDVHQLKHVIQGDGMLVHTTDQLRAFFTFLKALRDILTIEKNLPKWIIQDEIKELMNLIPKNITSTNQLITSYQKAIREALSTIIGDEGPWS